MKIPSLALIFCLLGCLVAHGADKKIDHDVVIGTLHGQLRYASEAFAVKPGTQVRVTLDNTDEMIHNWLLAKGGKEDLARIAEGALKLGPEGMKKGFIPEDDAILASIGLVQPGKKGAVTFTAPKETGDYPYVCTFPGHFLTMRGVMKVSEDPDKAIAQVKKIVAENTTPRNGILEVGDEPRVVRVHVKDVDSGRSIAVGLPGGVNYLFDAEKLMVRFGWTGGFLNVAPDRKGPRRGNLSHTGREVRGGSNRVSLAHRRSGQGSKGAIRRLLEARQPGLPVRSGWSENQPDRDRQTRGQGPDLRVPREKRFRRRLPTAEGGWFVRFLHRRQMDRRDRCAAHTEKAGRGVFRQHRAPINPFLLTSHEKLSLSFPGGHDRRLDRTPLRSRQTGPDTRGIHRRENRDAARCVLGCRWHGIRP